MTQDTFATRLRERMAQLGLTGYRIIKGTGIDQALFYRIGNGKRQPTPESLNLLAPILDLPVEVLQGWALADELARRIESGELSAAALVSAIESLPDDVRPRVKASPPPVADPRRTRSLKRASLQD